MNVKTKANLSANAFRSHYDASYAPSKAFKPVVAASHKQTPAVASSRNVGASAAAASNRHWLLDSVSGRDLLKLKLKLEVGKVKTSYFHDDAHLDADLERMVDLLGLRNWAAPKGLFGKLSAFSAVARYGSELHLGYSAPSLRDVFRA